MSHDNPQATADPTTPEAGGSTHAGAPPEPILLREVRDGIARLTLNRPSQYNSLSEEMLAALQNELDRIGDDESVKVVVLAGNGKAFCAGHDLKQMRSNPGLDYQRKLFAQCSGVMQTVTAIPQPVIARVHGIATAAGCQLVATCDLAIASTQARFATSGVNLGLFCTTPGVAVARNMLRKHAMEMLLTGDFIDAARAAEVGLVNRVVEHEELDQAVDALAANIAAKPASAIRLGKKAFYEQIDRGVAAAYEGASEVMACNMMEPDAAEGIDAFIEKRKPRWSGS